MGAIDMTRITPVERVQLPNPPVSTTRGKTPYLYDASVEAKPLTGHKVGKVPYVGTLTEDGMYVTGDVQGFRWLFATLAVVFVALGIFSPLQSGTFLFALGPLPAVGRFESSEASAFIAKDCHDEIEAQKIQGEPVSQELVYRKWRHIFQSINWAALAAYGSLAFASYFAPNLNMAAQWVGVASTAYMALFYAMFAYEFIMKIQKRNKLIDLLQNKTPEEFRQAVNDPNHVEYRHLRNVLHKSELRNVVSKEDAKKIRKELQSPFTSAARIAEIQKTLSQTASEQVSAYKWVLASFAVGFATLGVSIAAIIAGHGGDPTNMGLLISSVGVWFIFNLSAYFWADRPCADKTLAAKGKELEKITLGKTDEARAWLRFIGTIASIALFCFSSFYFGPDPWSAANIGLTVGCAATAGLFSLYYAARFLQKIYEVKKAEEQKKKIEEMEQMQERQAAKVWLSRLEKLPDILDVL